MFEFEPEREAGSQFSEDFAAVCEMEFFELFFSDEVIQTLTILMTTPTSIFLANKCMRILMAVGTQHHPRRSESLSPFICIWDWCVWGAMNSTGVQPACTMVSRADAFLQGSGSRLCSHFCMWMPRQ